MPVSATAIPVRRLSTRFRLALFSTFEPRLGGVGQGFVGRRGVQQGLTGRAIAVALRRRADFFRLHPPAPDLHRAVVRFAFSAALRILREALEILAGDERGGTKQSVEQ